MIQLMFQYGNEIILVIIKGTQVTFGNTTFGALMTDISGLKLNKEGVIKEFPDLKENKNWEDEAKKRFREKIKSLKTEMERAKYLVKDLKEHGYLPKFLQRGRHRRENIHGW